MYIYIYVCVYIYRHTHIHICLMLKVGIIGLQVQIIKDRCNDVDISANTVLTSDPSTDMYTHKRVPGVPVISCLEFCLELRTV